MMICCTLFLGLAFLSGAGVLYWQHQSLSVQRQIIEDQEIARARLQRQLDHTEVPNARIAFLENHVKELKQELQDSNTILKKNLALQSSSTKKLAELHYYICHSLSVSCPSKAGDTADPQKNLAWLEQVYQNFQTLDRSLHELVGKQHTFEEQALTIQSLRSNLVQAQQDLIEHVQYIESQKEYVAKLSKDIIRTTGISLRVSQKSTPDNLKNIGRGGATVQDQLSLETPQSAIDSEEARRYLYNYSAEYGATIQSLEALSLAVDRNQNFWKHTPTLKPVRGRVISDSYGPRNDPFTHKREFHSGVDFSARTGTAVIATADGVVKYSKRHKGYGLFVELLHGRGFYPGRKSSVQYSTRYAHMSKLLVKKGQWVKRGDKIGLVGSTGRSTGPHLHYEVLINNRHSDPMRLISRFAPQKFLYH